jgi:hypothetical protein
MAKPEPFVINSISDIEEIERRVLARELSRYDFEIAIAPEMANEVTDRPMVEQEETGWSQWGFSGRVTNGRIVMALHWTKDPAFLARYDTPLTRYDQEHEIGDLESCENGIDDW